MKPKDKANSVVIDATAALNAEHISQAGSAANVYVDAYTGTFEGGELIKKGLKQVAESRVHEDFVKQNLKQQAGFSVEIKFEADVNARNILDGKADRISRTDSIPGMRNDQRYDHVSLGKDGRVLFGPDGDPYGSQMKFCGAYETPEQIAHSAELLAKKMAGDEWERYRGKPVEIPAEQYEHVKNYAQEEARKLASKAQEFRAIGDIEKAELLELRAEKFTQVSEDVEDSGITSNGAMEARVSPVLSTVKSAGEVVHDSGWHQAKDAAIFGAAISIGMNTYSVFKKEKDIGQASIDVAFSIASVAGQGYLIGSTGAIISCALDRGGETLKAVGHGNIPAMAARASVGVGKSLIRLVKGQIDGVQFVEEVGEQGTGMLAASYGAAVGTAILPGVGTVAGAMLGSLLASTIYKASISVLHEAELSDLERMRVENFTAAAIDGFDTERRRIEESNALQTRKFQQVCFDAFSGMSKAAICNDHVLFVAMLDSIVIAVGRSLAYKNFDEFDCMMSDNEITLTI